MTFLVKKEYNNIVCCTKSWFWKSLQSWKELNSLL